MTTSKGGPKNVPSPNEGKSVYGRFIPREEVGEFAAWTPGSIDRRDPSRRPSAAKPADEPAAPPAPPAAPTAHDVATAQRAARQSGYQDGYRDGLAALDAFKQSYAMQVATQLGALLQSHDAELSALEHEMAAALTACALALARQVVRSELVQRPEAVAEVARQAVDALLLSARHVTVCVHPDDLPLVAQGAGEVLAARGARLVDDAKLARGGCRIEADLGGVDASIEARWKQVVAAIGSESDWSGAVVASAVAPSASPAERSGEGEPVEVAR